MTLFIFKYCLPALLGYTLFVGLAGRLNPFAKPAYVEERPSWLLGLWTGLSVSLVLGIGLHMAYGMSLEGAKSLLRPTMLFMSALLLPGFIGYFLYRRHVQHELAGSRAARVGMSEEMLAGNLQGFDDHLAEPSTTTDTESNDPLDPAMSEQALDTVPPEEASSPLLADYFDTAEGQTLGSHEAQAADHDAAVLDDHRTEAMDDALAASLDETIFEEFHYTPEELDATATADVAGSMVETEAGSAEPMDALVVDAETEAHASLPSPETASAMHEAALQATSELETRLQDEQSAHEETAKHLRITRKALAVLESESRDYESRKADAVIRLEEKLARSIDRQTNHESQAAREKDKRIELEQTVVTIKQNLVKAKQEVRRSTAARAKALSTANKSIAFARQAIQTRAQLEAEIDQIRETLANRQTTISSLIRELEREKSRTQEDISAMARQLVLHEKQVKARRSLEEVARSVENKLSSRLVKKVAKARPLISDL